jgi:AhpD family alkylhydroperoxidase
MEKIKDVKKTMSYLMKNSNEKVKSFQQMMESIEKEGVLTTKTKELIAIALAVKSQCSYCIEVHAKKCLDLGISKDEILEAAWVAVLMGGGPALMYMDILRKVLEE